MHDGGRCVRPIVERVWLVVGQCPVGPGRRDPARDRRGQAESCGAPSMARATNRDVQISGLSAYLFSPWADQLGGTG